jgi:AraC-like DNA-binding protein
MFLGAVMGMDEKLPEFLEFRDVFSNLEGILYNDIIFNGICVKPLGIHFMDNGSGWVVKNHRHSFFEAHYVTEGKVWTTLNGKEYEIEAGEFYIMPPGTFHSHRQCNGVKHIGFALRWELAGNFGTDDRNSKLFINSLFSLESCPIRDNGRVYDGMMDILTSAKKGSRVLNLQLSFFRLIMSFSDFSISNAVGSVDIINRSFVDRNTVKIAVRFVEENYSQNIDVTDVAKSVHLSYSQLLRMFKAHTGKTVNQYINQVRINKAQYLLKCTDRDIEAIAGETGFQSSIYFCSIFRKITGMTPGQYRKSTSRLLE